MRPGILPILAAGALLLAGCEKPEDNPSGGGKTAVQSVALQLSLSADAAMPVSQTLDYPTKADGIQLRHTVRVYRAADSGGWSSAAEAEAVLTSGDLSSPSGEVKLNLKPYKYKVLVWTDYVQGTADWLWNARDFSRIRIPDGAYQGGTPYRDAFFGSQELDLSAAGETYSGRISLTRPVAGYLFVATDASAFQGRSVQATVSYTEAVPSSFNLWEGAPADTRSGLSFTQPVEVLSDGTVNLAFDHLLVSGSDAQVPLTLRLQEGSTVLLEQSLTVPLQKGRRTVYKGKIFVSDGSAGISVDPSFEDEYNQSF